MQTNELKLRIERLLTNVGLKGVAVTIEGHALKINKPSVNENLSNLTKELFLQGFDFKVSEKSLDINI